MAISILYPSKRFGHEGVPRKLFTETFQSCACTRFLCMHKNLVHAQDSCACTKFQNVRVSNCCMKTGFAEASRKQHNSLCN